MTAKIIDFAFDKIDLDLLYMMGCFREVLAELGEPGLADRLPWLPASGAPRRADAELGERDVQVLSIAFQLSPGPVMPKWSMAAYSVMEKQSCVSIASMESTSATWARSNASRIAPRTCGST